MATLTKEQWADIEGALGGTYGRVELMMDGYPVVAEVQVIAPLKCGIVIFVNGVNKGEWYKGEAEEARKFLPERKRHLYPAKKREEARKWLRKRIPAEFKAFWRDVDQTTISTWYPYWTNAKAMTRQWRRTCTEIEIVKLGYA